MDRKLIGTMLLILASCGCRACDCSCDYLPPVLDGPYTAYGVRSGAATAGNKQDPEPLAGEAITPLKPSE